MFFLFCSFLGVYYVTKKNKQKKQKTHDLKKETNKINNLVHLLTGVNPFRGKLPKVCSSCLSVYCSDVSAICRSCGTRFKLNRELDPKIKDVGLEELAGSAQET